MPDDMEREEYGYDERTAAETARDAAPRRRGAPAETLPGGRRGAAGDSGPAADDTGAAGGGAARLDLFTGDRVLWIIVAALAVISVLVAMASWVMMLIGRVRFGELMKLVGWGVAAIAVVMTLNLGRSETAEGRVSTWIHLWTSSQVDKPIEHLTDTERSMIAIHNGGILGEGAGQSAMRVEMIHPESDYAYAFFVEEYGLLLAVVLLMLYLWIFFRAIEIFRRCGTAFPGLLVLGLALLITCQALLHVMVTVNLIPETGQTLPLISRGGSSTLFTTIALGMILSVSRQNDEQSHDRPRAETLYER